MKNVRKTLLSVAAGVALYFCASAATAAPACTDSAWRAAGDRIWYQAAQLNAPQMLELGDYDRIASPWDILLHLLRFAGDAQESESSGFEPCGALCENAQRGQIPLGNGLFLGMEPVRLPGAMDPVPGSPTEWIPFLEGRF